MIIGKEQNECIWLISSIKNWIKGWYIMIKEVFTLLRVEKNVQEIRKVNCCGKYLMSNISLKTAVVCIIIPYEGIFSC